MNIQPIKIISMDILYEIVLKIGRLFSLNLKSSQTTVDILHSKFLREKSPIFVCGEGGFLI